MVQPLVVAPAAAFLAVAALGAGIARKGEMSKHARRRLEIFVPAAPDRAGQAAATPPSLLKRRRFSALPRFDRLLAGRGWGERTSMALARAGLPLRAGEYVLARVFIASIALLLAGQSSLPAGMAAAGVAIVMPAAVLRWLQRRRVRRFDEQLAEGLSLVIGALKAGYSFPQAMQVLADESSAPLGNELREALREMQMGKPVEASLTSMAERVASADFELVLTATVIQRQVGGNLTEILSNIAATVRDRQRIQREVRTLTAEERLSGYVVAALPVALLALLTLMSPGYVAGMLATVGGKELLATAGGLELIGLVVIRRLVAIEI